MSKIRKILLALFTTALIITLGFEVALYIPSPSNYKKTQRAISDVVSPSSIVTQQMLDEAWQEALEVGGGNPEWKIPVKLDHVTLVPSTLAMGPHIYYGITITEAVFENGVLRLEETIEIHLAKNMQCHVKQVLVHELLHTVATRRSLTDHDFADAAKKAGDEETWVRQVYPIADMGLCK